MADLKIMQPFCKDKNRYTGPGKTTQGTEWRLIDRLEVRAPDSLHPYRSQRPLRQGQSHLCLLLWSGEVHLHVHFFQCVLSSKVNLHVHLIQCVLSLKVYLDALLPQSVLSIKVHLHVHLAQCVLSLKIHLHVHLPQCVNHWSCLLNNSTLDQHVICFLKDLLHQSMVLFTTWFMASYLLSSWDGGGGKVPHEGLKYQS